jgi:hypothetical protein
MIDVQAEHDLAVGEFRKRCKRCQKETLDQLQDQRTLEEKQADGASRKADQEQSSIPPAEVEQETCDICGNPADRKIALDVCREDYGMISDLQASDDVLMAQAETAEPSPPDTPDTTADASQAADALAQAAGIDPRQAQQVVDQVQQEAEQQAQEASHE